MASCALPERYRRDATIILVDQDETGRWGVHENRRRFDRSFGDRQSAMDFANGMCRQTRGAAVLAMPPLCGLGDARR